MSIIKCSSPSALKSELGVIRRKVSVQETGASWNNIEQGIVQLTECCKNGGSAFVTEMVAGIRSLSRPLNNAMNSERSRLSGATIELITALSVGLGPAFEPLLPIFIPTLLGLCARTSKVYTSRAKASIFAVIKHTQSSSILPYLAASVHNKSLSLRLVAAEGVLAYLNFNTSNGTRTHVIEDVIQSTSEDVSEVVRAVGKKIYEAYEALLPDSVESVIASSTTVTKKYTAVQGPASRLTSLSYSRPTAGRVGPVGSSACQGLRAPLQPGLSSMQSTNQQRDVVHPSVPTSQRPQRVASTTGKTRPPSAVDSLSTSTMTFRPSSRMASQSFVKAGHPATRGTGSRVCQSRSHELPTTDVVLQASSRTSSEKLVSGQEAIVQKTSMWRGQTVTSKGPEPVVKALPLCSKLVGTNHPDTSIPAQEDTPLSHKHTAAVPLLSSPVSPQLEPAEPLQAITNEHIPQDVNRPCVDATPLPCNTRDSPNPFLSSPCGFPLTPSRPSYKAVRFQRALRRPRHVPKRRPDPREDSVCINATTPAYDVSIHSRPDISLTHRTSCIHQESLFTPPSHDGRASDMSSPKSSKAVTPSTALQTYEPTPSPLDVNAQEALTLARTPKSPENVVTVFQGCELRQVVERLKDVRLDHATMLFYM